MSPEFKNQQERHRRIRFIKRLLRPLPRRATLHRYPVLKWFAEAARRRPFLWTFRVSAMTPAFYFGTVLALLPVMGVQVVLALAVALVLRANLPTLVGLQFITNPFTAAPIYLATYQVGDYVCSITGYNGPQLVGGPAAMRLVIGGIVSGIVVGAILDVIYRFLAYEARKHHWHLPKRKPRDTIDSPPPGPDQ